MAVQEPVDPMRPEHPRWREFCDRLGSEDGTCWTADGWRCFHDLRYANQILIDMGFPEQVVSASLEFFVEQGGHCDCEVLMNLDVADDN